MTYDAVVFAGCFSSVQTKCCTPKLYVIKVFRLKIICDWDLGKNTLK